MEKEMVIPEVGMGATYGYGSDCYPATIIWISESGKRIKIQGDDYKRTDNNGISELQEYEFTKNENSPVYEYSLRKHNVWREVGQNHGSLGIGFRRAYQDPHF